MKTPEWAKELAQTELGYVPIIKFRKSLRKDSSGKYRPKDTAWYNNYKWYTTKEEQILVNAGIFKEQHKIVFLHEIAHAKTYEEILGKHNYEFWEEAIRLYDKYNIPEEEYVEREFHPKRWYPPFRGIARKVYFDMKGVRL